MSKSCRHCLNEEHHNCSKKEADLVEDRLYCCCRHKIIELSDEDKKI